MMMALEPSGCSGFHPEGSPGPGYIRQFETRAGCCLIRCITIFRLDLVYTMCRLDHFGAHVAHNEAPRRRQATPHFSSAPTAVIMMHEVQSSTSALYVLNASLRSPSRGLQACTAA